MDTRMRKALIVTTMLMATTTMAHADQINPQPGSKVSEVGAVLQTVDSSANNAWYSLVAKTAASDKGDTFSKLYVVKHNFADRVNVDPFGRTHFELETNIYVDEEHYDHILNAQTFEDRRRVTTTQ